MLKITLKRVGRKKLPVYHIVVKDKRKTRNRNFIAKLGLYMPLKSYISFDMAQTKYWLNRGAIPTPLITKILCKISFFDFNK